MSLWKLTCLALAWASYMVVATPPAQPTDYAPSPTGGVARSIFRRLQRYDVGRLAVNVLVTGVLLAEIAFASGFIDTGSRPAEALSNSGHISPLLILGVLSATFGATLRLWSYHAMGHHFIFDLTLLKDHELVTHGPYAYVRHPGYTALVLNIAGLYACELSEGSWWTEACVWDGRLGKCVGIMAIAATMQLATLILRVPAEDRMLHEKFGRRWEEWRSKVPYMFIPRVL
ncbi:unnamed protein product [Peniophora sp. CBMAI 1063]|nr:unnamed protein product [Peniophora sp. CBMAI 1063]